MGPVAIGVIIGIIVLVLVIVVLNIKIVPQSKAYVIERLGAYSTTWQTGIHFKIPFIEKVSKTVSLKEQVVDFPPQPVIRPEALCIRRGAPDIRYRKSLGNNAEKHHRRNGA